MKITTTRKRKFFTIIPFIIIPLFALISCEADPIVPELNQSDKGKVNNAFTFNQISFSDLNSDQNFKKAYDKVFSVKNKQTTALKHSNFTIDTSSIKKINYGDNITYTMFVKRSEFNENYFENLILKIDSLKNIEAYIVKYTLNSPLEYYSEHESFSIDAQPEITRITLENTENLIMARSTCISLYSTRCNGTLDSGCTGSWHTPGPNCQCVVIYESGLDCSTQGDDPDTGSGNGSGNGSGSGSGSGGGGSGNDYNDGIVTAPNVDAYLWELKNFTSGELNRAQRSYYNSNANIKNNINTYLISKNFSVFSILDAKLAINVAMALSLDYKVFNWAFKNSNTILERASLYLTKNGNSPEAVAFAKHGILAVKQGGEVDFEDRIINNLRGKAECVYNLIQNGNTTINHFLKNFDGEFPVVHLKYELSSNLALNTNGVTKPPVNYIITIQLNSKTLPNRPNLMVARTIAHETIHAEMYRKLLSIANNGGNLNGLTVQDLNSMLSNRDFPGILQYYTQYGVNKFQHQQMASHYINVIAEALSDYDNNQHSYQFYKDISWVGLQGTNALINLSSAERNRILNVISSFNQTGNKKCP